MKTVELKIYSFDELSESAKQKAIDNNRPEEIFWSEENRETMEKFAAIFPITVKDWSYGGPGSGVSFSFDETDEIEELTGWRLATYLWNNYRKQIFQGKYYGRLSPTDAKGNKIEVSKAHPIGQRHVIRHSRIILQTSCVLTGYYMDDVILEPIYSFLGKPQYKI